MKNCPICHKKTTKPFLQKIQSVYSVKPYDIMHCGHCQHFFTSPLPSQSELEDIYKNRYSYAAHSLINGEKRMRAKKYARYIAGLGAKNALEIGCMHGLLLTELGRNGIKASGVEPGVEATEYCRSIGLDVVQSSLEDYGKEHYNKKYDAIIMSHVLEHIVEPEKQISILKNSLAKNGKIIVIVPNSMARSRRLFGRYWGYWQVPVHINHFNKSSATRLFKRAGFNVSEIKYRGADSLFFLSSLANRLGSKSNTHDLSAARKVLVRVASVLLRSWFYLGDEDILIAAGKAKP